MKKIQKFWRPLEKLDLLSTNRIFKNKLYGNRLTKKCVQECWEKSPLNSIQYILVQDTRLVD